MRFSQPWEIVISKITCVSGTSHVNGVLFNFRTPLKFNGVEWPLMRPGETELKYMKLDLPGRVINDPLKGIPKFWRDLNLNFNVSFQALYYD